MLAFHGDKKIKAKYLARVRGHIKADELIHGKYWEFGKGCAIGCTIHGSDLAAYETELGVPRILAKLEDGIFESLDNGRSKKWPEEFLSAIPVGADLSLVWPKFAVWMLVDPKWGVLQFAKSEKSRKVIQDVADAYKGVAEGSKEAVDWNKIRSAAAYYADAYSADAAAAAAYYAAYYAKWRIAQADKLLELMEEARAPKSKSTLNAQQTAVRRRKEHQP